MAAKLAQYASAGRLLADGAIGRRVSHAPLPLAWADRQAAGAVAGGLSLDRLYDRALIQPQHGDGRDHISPLQLLVFYAALVVETDDGTHSLVRHRQSPALGPLGFRILFGSSNLGDGLLALAKFYELSSRTMRLELRTEGEQAFLALHVEDERGDAPLEEDIQLVYLHLGLTSFLGRPFPVAWVGTRDPEHLGLGASHYFIGAPVRRGGTAGIAFPRALLTSPPSMRGFQEFGWAPIERALSLMALGSSAPPGLNNQELRLSRLAAEAGMAPSTYRRTMAREGVGFRQLRERALIEAILDQLRTRPCSVDAIAADLGFSDARSLRRFVKRATGRTPNELRTDFVDPVAPATLYARFRDILGAMQL